MPDRATKISALADPVVRAWKDDARKARDSSITARLHTRERSLAIRKAIEERDFHEALDAMASAVGSSQWHLITRAFSLMSASERAVCLRRVWCESKSRMSPARALPLFREATLLRKTVPGWPREGQLYRGALAATWQQAKRRAKHGLSWTTDREVALAFAELPLYALNRVVRGAAST